MSVATIMIADDSRTIRRLLREALEPAGLTVLEAVDGCAALETLDGGASPDLLITDVNMPRMDGISLVRAVRTRTRLKTMPILVLTTESGEEMKQAGRAAGATGWLVKPFHPDQLTRVVYRVLRKAL